MSPEKISHLLNKLELNDVHLKSDDIEEFSQSDENSVDIPQPKKGKAIKVKKEPKRTKGKNTNEVEHDVKEELIPAKIGASKEKFAKTDKTKTGQKVAEDNLTSKYSNNADLNSNSTDSVPPKVSSDKNSKRKKANELEHGDKEEPIAIKVGASKEETAKTGKPKRGQKDAADVDSLNSKASNKAGKNSNPDVFPSEVENDKKPNKSKKADNGKGKEDSKEKVNIQGENTKGKETISKSKISAKTNDVIDKTATKNKNPSTKKNQDTKEATLKEKPSKPTKKTVNEKVDIKASKVTEDGFKPEPLRTNEGEQISKRTRANKISAQENIKQEDETNKVEEKPKGTSRRNKNQTDQDEVPKSNEKDTILGKEKVENPKKKANAKPQISQDIENKENVAKNTKVKPKTEPSKKGNPINTKENTVVAENLVTKRVTRKNK